MPAVIHYGDDHAPAVALRFGLGCGGDALGIFQSEHRFAGHDQLSPNTVKTWSRILSTLPTPGTFRHFGAFASPDFAQAL